MLEDSELQAAVIADALAPLASVRLFLDSPQMLEALSERQPDVLILDLHVPQVSGLEVLQIVRQSHDEVTLPVLILTSAEGSQASLEALAAGANDYALKPFLAAELKARVATLVRVRNLHARARLAERELASALAREAAARIQAEADRERLAESEERQRRVVDASGAGLWELDVASGRVTADSRMLTLMGTSPHDEMTVDSGFAAVHEEDVERLAEAVRGALAGENGGRYALEFRTGGRDGVPLRWVESRAQATFDAQGRATRLAGALIDVSARKWIEGEREVLHAREAASRADAQRERETLYSLFMQVPVAIAILEGADPTFTFANPAYRALVDGLEVVGKTLSEVLHVFGATGVTELIERVVNTGEPALIKEMPVRLAHRADTRSLDFVCTPKRNELGALDGVMLSGWDVTELVRGRQRLATLSEELKASELQLRLVTDALPVLVSFVTADERYGLVNRAYEEWFGLSAEQMIGRTVREVIGEPAYEVMGKFVKRGLAGERFSFDQYGVPYRHGGTRDVRVSFIPLRLGDERSDGYVALVQDISVQRALEAERERLADQRAEQLRKQSLFEQQLIGIVSHDLRTPLNVITLSSARLARDEGLTPTALKNVVRIQNATDRAARMVADLLDFTQARLGGGIHIERRRVDIHKQLGALIVELEAAYPEREIAYSHEGDGEGEWDPERVTQAAQNLISNALKYSPAESVVRVVTRGEAGSVSLSVHNLGVPIAEHKLPVLFEPMQRGVEQADNLTRSVGLGLYIVKEIVEAHGGSVIVRSDEQSGTTFTATFPTASHQV